MTEWKQNNKRSHNSSKNTTVNIYRFQRFFWGDNCEIKLYYMRLGQQSLTL